MDSMKHSFPSVALVALALLSAVAGHSTAEAADRYVTRVAVDGLARPMGIVADGSRTLYVTQVPTPGVGGADGGENTVDRIQLSSGQVTTLTRGEPEPTNLALDPRGVLYWTCKSAGVILARSRAGDVVPFLTGLEFPSGIAADRWGRIFFTQLPTPGVPGSGGGMNTVNVSDGEGIEVLTVGEPEPTDIAVSRAGVAYWTCRSAGVILMRSAAGRVSLLLGGLKSPTGIALDARCSTLFFTEVPEPGMAGGGNRVSAYDLAAGRLTVVDEGDPEPTDVTVAPNGWVYWTCTSAGVIVEARPVRD